MEQNCSNMVETKNSIRRERTLFQSELRNKCSLLLNDIWRDSFLNWIPGQDQVWGFTPAILQVNACLTTELDSARISHQNPLPIFSMPHFNKHKTSPSAKSEKARKDGQGLQEHAACDVKLPRNFFGYHLVILFWFCRKQWVEYSLNFSVLEGVKGDLTAKISWM